MLLSKSSPIRLRIKKGIRSLGEMLVSFSKRISYTPVTVLAHEGRWTICRHNGIEWKLDTTLGVDSAIYHTGVFEPDSTRLVHRLVKPGMIVADVGANFGYYTIQFSKTVGDAGKVYAFEPSLKFQERLIHHIDRNQCTNVRVIREGLSDRAETLRLYDGGDSASFYFGDSNDKSAPVENVRLVTFDSFVRKEKLSRLDFMKVDIDGHEMRFFRGAKKALTTLRPMILVECMQLALQKAGSDVEELVSYLRGLKYELRSEKTGRPFLDDDELFRETKNCAYSANILCVPENVNRNTIII